jgi:putative FmdB family regulatory protein
MPIYEYECTECGYIQEVLYKKEFKRIRCDNCGGSAKKIMSSGTFFVNGYNAKNGYNLPNYSDLIDENGNSKTKWGKK